MPFYQLEVEDTEISIRLLLSHLTGSLSVLFSQEIHCGKDQVFQ